MADLVTQIQPAVTSLNEKSTDELYKELGLRVQAMQQNVAISASFTPDINRDVQSQGAAEDLQKFGKIFFDRINVQAYTLICGSQSQDSEQRQQVMDAFGASRDAVGAAIAGLLIAQLGLAPAIAPVVAMLILRIVFRPAYDAMCGVWKEKQPQNG